jgi:ornithine carbamoyltransferase
MFDAIQFRGYHQKTVQTLADYAGVPVYNGLTDLFHPTQILADLLTLEEEWGSLEGHGPLVYLGDGRNNMGNSLMIGCAIMNLPFTISSPKALQPEEELISLAKELGGPTWDFRLESDPKAAVQGAGALYTDVWASMGEEDLLEERKKILGDYQVNQDLLDQTGNPNSLFLHCLPAVRGNEVTAEVMEGPQSLVWEEAENRKHTIKAIILATLIKEIFS